MRSAFSFGHQRCDRDRGTRTDESSREPIDPAAQATKRDLGAEFSTRWMATCSAALCRIPPFCFAAAVTSRSVCATHRQHLLARSKKSRQSGQTMCRAVAPPVAARARPTVATITSTTHFAGAT
jgi:hypothetical protein